MLREKFALTERGAFEFKRGAFFCALANLVMMAPIGVLCMATNDYLDHLLDPSKPLPALGGYLAAIVVILLLMLLTQWLEYHFTYNVVYGESARKRIELAEVLRRLPLSFFGRRDLSDLTTTIMKDCADQERMFSHIMPLLFGTGVDHIDLDHASALQLEDGHRRPLGSSHRLAHHRLLSEEPRCEGAVSHRPPA